MIQKKVLENMYSMDTITNEFATKNKEAIRFIEEDSDIRPPFFRDTDRIIHSLAYSRYMDKTQVFINAENDHITKRMIHVQLVSKIARTIGRALGLNEDLIEAAALGHDLGHTPFGHAGEYILNELSLEYNQGYFNHNIQSVRLLRNLEKKGEGLNITLQTLDAIMCHNGEFVLGHYEPKEKTKEEFIREYEASYNDASVLKTLRPMTLEGCVVRISDIIAYLGRDIEDAVRLKVFNKKLIPREIKSVLGITNKEIVNTVIIDVINNSLDKPYIEMSEKVYYAIKKLKTFNYDNIYGPSLKSEEKEELQRKFRLVFETYLKDINENNQESLIYVTFLKYKNKDYLKNNPAERKVIDYIAGMTDDFFQKNYNLIINN